MSLQGTRLFPGQPGNSLWWIHLGEQLHSQGSRPFWASAQWYGAPTECYVIPTELAHELVQVH